MSKGFGKVHTSESFSLRHVRLLFSLGQAFSMEDGDTVAVSAAASRYIYFAIIVLPAELKFLIIMIRIEVSCR